MTELAYAVAVVIDSALGYAGVLECEFNHVVGCFKDWWRGRVG